MRKRGKAKKERVADTIKQLEVTEKHFREMALMCYRQSIAISEAKESLEKEQEGRMYMARAELAKRTINRLVSEQKA